MADVIATLHKRNDPDTNIYPNVKDTNIPDTILRVADLGKYVNLLTSININGDADYVSVTSDIGTFTTADITTLNVSGTADIEGKATFGSDVEVDGSATFNSPESLVFKTGSLDFSELTNFISTYNAEAYQFLFANLELYYGAEGGTTFNPSVTFPNFANGTNFEGCFQNCTATDLEDGIVIPDLNYQHLVSFKYAFRSASVVKVTFGSAYALNFEGAFLSAKSLTEVSVSDGKTCYVSFAPFTFQYISTLTTIGAFDMSKCDNFTNWLSGCTSLKSILCTHFKVSFDISPSTAFEESDLVTIISNLDTVTTAQTLTMGSTNLAKLTQDEILVATGKGWTLA